jgi:hypothetical protein
VLDRRKKGDVWWKAEALEDRRRAEVRMVDLEIMVGGFDGAVV